MQLKVMLRCFKRDGDDKLPSTKQDQFARYVITCPRGDVPAPKLPRDLPPVTPSNKNRFINPVDEPAIN